MPRIPRLLVALAALPLLQDALAASTPAEALDPAIYQRIEAEGRAHGRAMEFATALADGIGPRLTGSPNLRKAHEWTRDTLAAMGLDRAEIEDWGEFGMGWYQVNAAGRLIAPDTAPLWLHAVPWSAATPGPVSGEVLFVPLDDEASLDAVRGRLRGRILLLGRARPVAEVPTPLSYRYTSEELAEIQSTQPMRRQIGPTSVTPAQVEERRRLAALRERAARMAAEEGAAAILLPGRDNGRFGGTGMLFADNTVNLLRPGHLATNRLPVPCATVMPEHYNRLARLAATGVPVRVEVDIQTVFTGDHEHGYNTLAEITGSDPRLRHEVVMVGGHLDSWISGTGATDNGAGAVIAMEAMRILKALKLKPRRTIRIGLWGGEEQGELGSGGHVARHYARLEPATGSEAPRLVRLAGYEQLVAYYNLDEGGGRIRGIFAQGNEAIMPIFEQWIAPLKDLGVTTVARRDAVGSDHLSFDAVGLPGFSFIQDELDYETRTHHSNLDTVDHLVAEDLQQAAIVEAIFLWNSSQRDARLPRKPPPAR